MKLVKDFSIIIAAGITVGGVIYSARNHTITQAESDRRELDKELLINAFSLDDSLSQRRRLELFVDLNLFSKDMITALDNKLDSNEITFGKNTVGAITFFDTVDVGKIIVDSISDVQVLVKRMKYDSNTNDYYCDLEIRRKEYWDDYDGRFGKPFETQIMPTVWTYNRNDGISYGIIVNSIPGSTTKYLLTIQRTK